MWHLIKYTFKLVLCVVGIIIPVYCGQNVTFEILKFNGNVSEEYVCPEDVPVTHISKIVIKPVTFTTQPDYDNCNCLITHTHSNQSATTVIVRSDVNSSRADVHVYELAGMQPVSFHVTDHSVSGLYVEDNFISSLLYAVEITAEGRLLDMVCSLSEQISSSFEITTTTIFAISTAPNELTTVSETINATERHSSGYHSFTPAIEPTDDPVLVRESTEDANLVTESTDVFITTTAKPNKKSSQSLQDWNGILNKHIFLIIGVGCGIIFIILFIGSIILCAKRSQKSEKNTNQTETLDKRASTLNYADLFPQSEKPCSTNETSLYVDSIVQTTPG